MSIEISEEAHDRARRQLDDEEVSDRRADGEEELVAVVCPNSTYEQLESELDGERDRRCREYEHELEALLVERDRLAERVENLERRLEQKESQLDAVVTRNERVLKERTESCRERVAEREGGDFVWTGRRQESGLLARVKSWFR